MKEEIEQKTLRQNPSPINPSRQFGAGGFVQNGDLDSARILFDEIPGKKPCDVECYGIHTCHTRKLLSLAQFVAETAIANNACVHMEIISCFFLACVIYYS
ncbi:hypothetical protein IFM89_011288 [Coptis chinensis]|uniref:Uncharacterized protein n=1 Tax=Coptis chinensis TaxID=261450 RepID=A0A835HSF9_9MAGN|nr:hypothetical protein IFM89_011288 [Coptis chinensis]